MKQRLLRSLAIAATLAAVSAYVAPTSATQLLNKNFETGDLSGWAFSGSPFAQAVDSSFGVPALQGDYSALLVSLGDNRYGCSIDPWGYGCPVPIPFASADASTPPGRAGYSYGTGISQQLALNAGDAISFDFQLFSNDGQLTVGLSSADQFVVTLSDGIVATMTPGHFVCGAIGYPGRCPLAVSQIEVTTPDAPMLLRRATGTPAGFRQWDNVYEWQFVAPRDGVWTLSLAIGSIVDGIGSSGVLIDNFHILPHQAQALPEPGSLALLTLVLAVIGTTHRRRSGDDASPGNVNSFPLETAWC